MWRLDLKQDLTDMLTGGENNVVRTFMFASRIEREQWLDDKVSLQAKYQSISHHIDHENKVIHLTAKTYNTLMDKFLSDVDAFVAKWGNHRVSTDIEINVNNMQRTRRVPVTMWPVTHVHESGNMRKQVVFDSHMDFSQWKTEAMELKKELEEMSPEPKEDLNAARRWISKVHRFHKTWGDKIIPEIVRPLHQIEAALDMQRSAIEPGCWTSVEKNDTDEGELIWFGSYQL